MAYNLLIKKQADKVLQRLSRVDKNRITEKIIMLGENPDNPVLDIKSLKGRSYYRLRVGKWRIIYDKQDDIKIIAIEKIASRGEVYK